MPDLETEIDRDANGAARPTSLSKQQIVSALVDIGNPSGANALPNITNAIDPLGANAASAEWIAAAPGDALNALIQSELGWSDAQMAAFITLARSKPL